MYSFCKYNRGYMFVNSLSLLPMQSQSDVWLGEHYVHALYLHILYSKTCLKGPLKNRQNKDLTDKW